VNIVEHRRRHKRRHGRSRAAWFPTRVSQRIFFGVSALLFIASAALTIAGAAPCRRMDGMPMPGGWTLSMAWMRIARTELARCGGIVPRHVDRDDGGDDAPSLMPMLCATAGHRHDRWNALGGLTALVGSAYFFVWVVLG